MTKGRATRNRRQGRKAYAPFVRKALANATVDALVGRLGVGELVVAAAIAAFLDELPRSVEIVAR